MCLEKKGKFEWKRQLKGKKQDEVSQQLCWKWKRSMKKLA